MLELDSVEPKQSSLRTNPQVSVRGLRECVDLARSAVLRCPRGVVKLRDVAISIQAQRVRAREAPTKSDKQRPRQRPVRPFARKMNWEGHFIVSRRLSVCRSYAARFVSVKRRLASRPTVPTSYPILAVRCHNRAVELTKRAFLGGFGILNVAPRPSAGTPFEGLSRRHTKVVTGALVEQ